MNEPVAWMRKETDEEGEFLVFLEEEPSWCEAIPLYTHPVKQLTLEKLEELYQHSHGNTEYMRAKSFMRAIIKEITE